MNPENPSKPIPIPPPAVPALELEPIKGPVNPFSILDALLKNPGHLAYELSRGRSKQALLSLFGLAVFCFGIYGLVAGSLSGGNQLWVAPAKILIGAAAATLICLPSLYIFLCLSGSSLSIRNVSMALLASVALTGLLLIGFAPVAWIFSQSTESVGFMAFLHLIFWVVGLWFGMRLLSRFNSVPGESRGNFAVWVVIYSLVCLQMLTSLRPILADSDTFLPREKKFFLAQWVEVVSGSSR